MALASPTTPTPALPKGRGRYSVATQPWRHGAAWAPARAGQRDPLGRGHDKLFLFPNKQRIPGRPRPVAERDPGACPKLDSGPMLYATPRFHCCRKAFKRRGGFQTLPYRKRTMLPGRQTFIQHHGRAHGSAPTTHYEPTTVVKPTPHPLPPAFPLSTTPAAL